LQDEETVDMMQTFVKQRARLMFAATLAALSLAGPSLVHAQRGGGAPQGPPTTAQAAAPYDLTGYWESYITEDWRWRMITPPKGDYQSVPLNDNGRKTADTWDADRDIAAGQQCKAYGAPAVMRHPGRIRISWQDPNTLKIETEAGTQTRLLHFNKSQPPPAQATLQGHSVAEWQTPEVPGGRNARGRMPTTLKVVTTRLQPGYLRKNGVPHSGNAVVTEYINLLEEADGGPWLIVSNFVEDPQYLNQPFATSTHFKKLTGGSPPWKPEPCIAK
jgi:hypothetical protein